MLRCNMIYKLAIFYPPLTYIGGCFGLFLQAQKGSINLTDLDERVEHVNYYIVGARRRWSPEGMKALQPGSVEGGSSSRSGSGILLCETRAERDAISFMFDEIIEQV